MRPKGSSGGHNGLKSIEMYLDTESYPRLRIGVGSPTEGRMKDYVLGSFSQEERPVIEEIIAQAVHALELWLKAGIVEAMHVANVQKMKPLGDKDNGQTTDTPL
jgi:PTH1 family peptidyl-tRNA hydrolase